MGKFNAKLLFAIFMVLILCSVQAIAAADDAGDIVASDNGDLSEEISNDNVINNDQLMASNDDALAAEQGTFTDLKNEISKLNSDNSTLVLSKDYVRADNENTISISKKMNITIIGNGHKIDANQLGTIFTVSSPVVLKDIVFVNSFNKYSSAISLQPTSAGSIIDSCTFENNNGGAITVNANNVTITDSTFINNTNKAAIYILNNNAVVSNCNFLKNTNGGGIYTQGNNTTIMDSTFESNNGIYGGAIHLGANKGPAKVINSKFTNNTADAHMDAIAYGGAIYVDSPNVLLDNLDFNDNMASTQGGAIYVHEKNAYNMVTNVTINNSRFNNNRVGGTYTYGGAIFSIAPHLKVYNSEFNNNSAPYGGGAISVMFLRNTIEIENCTFKKNTAKIQGGAVEIQAAPNSTIKNCVFEDNSVTSYYGGAVFVTGVNVTLENVVFKNNTAISYGGAVYAPGANANIKNAVFEGNSAKYGGAVALSGANSSIADSSFENNKASVWGGAIYTAAKNITVDNSEFNFNQALYGSAIAVYNGGSMDISNSKLLNNLALSYKLTVWAVVNSTKVDIHTQFMGYDNLLNGILANGYYQGDSEVTVQNVTYLGENAAVLNTGSEKVAPVTSSSPDKVYSDFREAGIPIDVVITDSNGNVVARGLLGYSNSENIIKEYNNQLTDIYGDVNITGISLKPGKYNVTATHKLDNYYTEIVAKSSFEVPKINTNVTSDNVTNRTGAVMDIPVDVTDEFGEPVANGTVKSTINGVEYAADVVDGKAIFKNVALPDELGNYTYPVEYSGNDYYVNSTGNVNIETIEIKPAIIMLNTTTTSDDIEGHEGDVKNVTANIVDNRGNPVQNGTATLAFDGNIFTAEVKDGKAVFTGIELPAEDTEAVINYNGNEYYNSSSTAILITIIADPDPSPEPIPDPEPIPVPDPTPGPNPNPNPGPNPSNGGSSSANGGANGNGVAGNNMHNTGNPIFAILLVLFVLVSNISLRRKE